MKTPTFITYKIFDRHPEVTAFSTLRHGGCSTGAYASMNCTSYTGDDAECVHRNREILCDLLPHRPKELVIPHQVHGCDLCYIDDRYLNSSVEQREKQLEAIDAIATTRQGVCVCVSTADCVPILLYDPKEHLVAAVHAGWRGTVEGILKKALASISAHGSQPSNVVAAIGPCISLEAFEVGDEVYKAFKAKGYPMNDIALRNPDTGKWHIDLPKANLLQMLEAGVPEAQVEVSGICTHRNYKDFFSARRLGIASGRILSGIMLCHR